MPKLLAHLLLLGALVASQAASSAAFGAPVVPSGVTLGVDVLLTDEIEVVRGKRVGLITNQSGVDGMLVPTSVRLAQDKRVKLRRLYAPEHGLRGVASAGKSVEDEVDPVTGVPVVSLFGGDLSPTEDSLAQLDVLVFDIQDVGSRTYTYVSTMGKAMKAAKRAGIPFVVLDRPNPQGGRRYEGPVIERKYRSFIGWGPLPVTHGMTVGELARFYNAELGINCKLHVVQMKGWTRNMVWQDTGLSWVPTSPGIPHPLSAQLYVATGMIGGVTKNVNEGVGFTLPFEAIAATFADATKLTKRLEAAGLPGVRFRPISYRPFYHRHKGKLLHGVQIVPTNLHTFRPLRTALTMMTTLQAMYGRRMRFRGRRRFGMTWGNTRVLDAVRAGTPAKEIEASWQPELDAFGAKRVKYLLY